MISACLLTFLFKWDRCRYNALGLEKGTSGVLMRRLVLIILLLALLPATALAQSSFHPRSSERIQVPYQPAGSLRARPMNTRLPDGGARSAANSGVDQNVRTVQQGRMSNCYPAAIGCVDLQR